MTTPTTIEDARAVIATIRNLHKPGNWQWHHLGNVRICGECLHRWPCDTVLILGDNV